MQFSRNGRWLMVSRITGPTHNVLQVDLTQVEKSPSIEALPAIGDMPAKPLEASQVLQHVIAGVNAANRELGTSYHVGAARFIADDSRPESVYRELAWALVRRLARDEADPPSPDTSVRFGRTGEEEVECTYSPLQRYRVIISRDVAGRYRVHRERWNTGDWEIAHVAFWSEDDRTVTVTDTLGNARKLAAERLFDDPDVKNDI